jgi:hypothetical protein
MPPRKKKKALRAYSDSQLPEDKLQRIEPAGRENNAMLGNCKLRSPPTHCSRNNFESQMSK